MRIAQMRKRITFQSKAKAPDGGGGFDDTWTDVVTVSARITPVKGSESVDAGQLQTGQTYLITIRHRSDITTKHRISWAGNILNIRSVTNRDERRKFTTIEAELPNG